MSEGEPPGQLPTRLAKLRDGGKSLMNKNTIVWAIVGAAVAAALASLFFYIVIAWILGYDVNLF